MLCAIVVLVLLSAVLVVGIRLAAKVYIKSVSYSEAQVLCSTLSSAISDELRYSADFSVDAEGNLTGFFSRTQGGNAMLTVDGDGIVLINGNKLIPAASYTYGEKAVIEFVTYDEEKECFNVSLKIERDGDVLASSEFSVKKLNDTNPS